MTLHRFTFRAMAAQNEVQLHATDARLAQRAANAAIAEVARIEAKFSRYRPDSLVSRINAAAGRAPVDVDDETSLLLDYADACFRQSGGLFDATSGILRRAWRFDESRVPTEEELQPLVAKIGWERVERNGARVRLPEAGMELDFGGFGKEYAVDRAAAVVLEYGVERALVNLAGDLMITGPQPEGTPWRVGVRHPRREGSAIATLEVRSGAVATSGDYERYLQVGGVRHCHLLDPRSGRPAHGLQSATALAPSCLVAGTATTVAMLKPELEALAWLRDLGLRFLAVRGDGSVLDGTGAALPT
jgi:thiamine biosynthesis lipoprotein